jgi:hypothetical protein
VKLSNAGKYRARPVLRIINGNPLAVGRDSDKDCQKLTLVWNNSMSGKSTKTERQASQTLINRSTSPLSLWRRGWRWLNDNGNAITVTSAFVTILGAAAWNILSVYSRLGQLEVKLDQILTDVSDLKGRIGKLEGNVTNLQGRLSSPPNISYEKKAAELGLKEPQITPISLSPSSPPQTISQAEGSSLACVPPPEEEVS